MRKLAVAALVMANAVLISSVFDVFWVERQLDSRNFSPDSGNCYVYAATLFTPSDTTGAASSELRLLENGRLLEYSHAQHEAIRQAGRGRFSHWGDVIYMSSSDNSDPRTNGRVYTLAYPLRPPSAFVGPVILLSVLLLPLGAARVEDRKDIYKRYYFPVLAMMFSTVLVIVPIELFLRTDYSKRVFGAFHQLPLNLEPTVNAKGYRDAEHAMLNPTASVRIVILGDSFTFGDGVADDEIYPRLLQRKAGPNVEIISLAKDGWGTADQLAALRREGLAYHPHIVVLGVVTNDPSPPLTEPLGQSRPWMVFQSISPSLMLSRLLDFRLNALAESLAWKYGYRDWENDLYDPNKRYRAKWEKAVVELSQELLPRGISAYAVLLTGPAQANERDAWKFKILEETFRKAGFKTYNLFESYVATFEGVDPTALFALPDDSHPGRAVHEFYANELWKVLQSEAMRHQTGSDA
jgi:hypothetical protein